MSLDQIIKSAIDLHYHIGPEIIPRKYNNVNDLIKKIRGKISALALKNHFYPTTSFIKEIKNQKNINLIGSIVLNNYVGGLNSEAIYAASIISNKPIIVWFPTINAQNFLNKTKYEIAPEWIKSTIFIPRNSQEIKGINIINKRQGSTNLIINVLKTIKKTNSILATGHISSKETIFLVNKALEIGIKKIIITHPIYQKININLKNQMMLAKKGCYIEICYSMYSIDKIPIKKIAYQIKKIGAKNIILSSDVGQIFSPDPDIALKIFSKLLLKEKINLKMLYQMLVENPKKLLNI